jgi:3-dehydroquinate synthase
MTVQSSKHPYNVLFVDNYISILKKHLVPGDVVVVDANILAIHKEQLTQILQDIFHIVIEPSEKQKSYQGIEPFINQLIEAGFRKNNRLLAIGGGVVQDITAFISSILFRGVDWFFYPSTLLAQCDSCIGSKTSINFGEYKNQLGGFYPPKEIIIDVNFLKTLSALDFRSGMGEMLHYYLVSGEEDFQRISREYDLAFKDPEVLCELVAHSLEIKRGYVERDEFDQGPRNVFNYGHSFGHALETMTDYEIPHGIAVSIGMDLANYLSVKKGYIKPAEYDGMHSLLQKNWGEVRLPGIVIDDLIALLRKDKKAVGSEIHVILTKGLGQMFKTPLPVTPEMLGWLADYFELFNRPSSQNKGVTYP